MPEDCLRCLDEAYVEFAPEDTAPDWDPEDSRVIRFRTFSKAHGMAGMRIGYAVSAPEIAAAFDRIRNHFGVTRVAQAAALAALGDAAHMASVQAAVAEARERIGAIAAENGLVALPSATNFVAVNYGRDGDFARRLLAGLLAGLLARDIFVRMPGVAPLDRCIRISAGRPRELDLLASCLADRRGPARVTHSRAAMIRARVMAIACGYEDCGDLDALRHDPAMKTACQRVPDAAPGLASQPTLSRLENLAGRRALARMGLRYG